MWRKVASGYPKRKEEDTKTWKNKVSRAVASMWNNLPTDAKKGVIQRHSAAKYPALGMLACPKCGTPNPVTKEHMHLRCKRCKLPLVSVRVKKR